MYWDGGEKRREKEEKNRKINVVALILPYTLASQKRANREIREESAKAHESCFQTQNDVIFHDGCLFSRKLFNKHFSISLATFSVLLWIDNFRFSKSFGISDIPRCVLKIPR